MSMIFLLFFLVTLTIPLHSSEKAHPSLKHDLASFHYMSPISKTDFRNVGESSLIKTYTQTSPNTYVLIDHVGYQGASSSTAAGGNTAIFELAP